MIKINESRLSDIQRGLLKAEREAAVARIVVTTTSGLPFDGDETSQDRMTRTILGLQAQPEGATVRWVLADNRVADISLSELQEALALAVAKQNELWAPV